MLRLLAIENILQTVAENKFQNFTENAVLVVNSFLITNTSLMDSLNLYIVNNPFY